MNAKSRIRIIGGEWSDHDKEMLRGFTHDMSNTVTSNMLILRTVLEHGETLCYRNAENLGYLFDLIEQDIPEEKRDKVLKYFETIERNEQKLDNVLRILNRSNQRAVDVARLVSEFSRLGRKVVSQEPVRLQEILEVVIRECREQFIGQKISIQTSGDVKGLLSGHKPHLHSLFKNIVVNACQALAEVEDGRERVVEITLSEAEDSQMVSFCDNANGIPEEHLQNIFEPFYSTRMKTAVGLGLNFVKKQVSLYNGTLEVESEPGKGTIITVSFPISSSICC